MVPKTLQYADKKQVASYLFLNPNQNLRKVSLQMQVSVKLTDLVMLIYLQCLVISRTATVSSTKVGCYQYFWTIFPIHSKLQANLLLTIIGWALSNILCLVFLQAVKMGISQLM